jgi:hypothetical protein
LNKLTVDKYDRLKKKNTIIKKVIKKNKKNISR